MVKILFPAFARPSICFVLALAHLALVTLFEVPLSHAVEEPASGPRLRFKTETKEKTIGQCEQKTAKDCASIRLSWPVPLSEGKTALSNSISSFVDSIILKQVFDGELSSRAELLRKFEAEYLAFKKEMPDSAQVWEFHSKIEVIVNDERSVGLKAITYSYLGGAHPNTTTHFANFDTRSGKALELNDLFQSGWQLQLNKIAEQIFRRERGLSRTDDLEEKGYFFDGGQFRLNDNFLLEKSELRFHYNAYEIAPYAAGPTELVLPYRTYAPLLKEISGS